MNRNKKLWSGVLIGAFGLFATACAPAAESAESGAQVSAAPESVSIGVYGPGLEYAFVYVADGPDGMFADIEAEYGTTIEVVPIPSGSNLVSSLAGGSTQFAVMPGVSTIASAQQGMPVQPLMGAFVGPATFILGAQKYEQERGQDLTAYDGDRWAFSRIGSVGHLVAQEVAASEGLEWSNQQELPLGSGADAQAALSANKAEVLVTGGEPGIKAIQEGLGYLVMNTQADESLEFAKNINSIVNTTVKFEQEYPDLVQDMTTAMLDGYIKLRDAGSADAALALLPEDARTQVAGTWDMQWEMSRSGLSRASTGFTQEELAATIKLGQAGEAIAAGDTDTSLFRNDFVSRAYTELGLDEPAFD